jgi:Trypsin
MMRATYAHGGRDAGCEPPRLSYRRLGAIACRSAFLLSGTAAIALAASSAQAIVINDGVVGSNQANVANYYDLTNVYSNVVNPRRLQDDDSTIPWCTGSLINSRTILTAAHCLYDSNTGQPIKNLTGVSFRPDAVGDNGTPVSGFKGYLVFRNDTATARQFPVTNDIAVISLAQPVTNITPVRLLTLQPGQAGFPTQGTTILWSAMAPTARARSRPLLGVQTRWARNCSSRLWSADRLTTGAGSGRARCSPTAFHFTFPV